MPLEIRELHIKVSVTDGEEQKGGGTSGTEDGGNEAVVSACVEKVLEILKDKQER